MKKLLTPLGGGTKTSDGKQANSLLNAADNSAEATIIVQLDGTNPGIPWYRSLFGTTTTERHDYVKNQISELVASQPSTARSQSRSVTPTVRTVRDYYHAIDGFAITAPANTVDDIVQLRGVKTAFVEQVHQLPKNQGDQPVLKNQSSLDMTQAGNVDYKGDGQTIAIIDSGLDTDHEAFKGDLNDATVKETKADINTIKPTLNAGKNGAYVSEKIPFVYDYADNDNDVHPSSVSGMEHGTHVAGIAAANSGAEIRGTAPDAQIIAMKVARDADGGLPDSAILAALDDAVVLKPDTVNMSLGIDAGFSDASSEVFGSALVSVRNTGATVNVAAGNAYSSAYANKSGKNLPYASDPDSSVISSPAAFTDSFAVASVNNSERKSAFLAPDGSTIAYVVMKINEGGESQDLDTLADGKYTYVDAGVGSESDADAAAATAGGSLTGKIALVQRGGETADGTKLSFTDKVKNLAAKSASAIVIYNNEDSDLSNAAVQGITDFPPTVTISKTDGEKLKAAETKEITLKAGTLASASKAYSMSDFSSWGVTPDLKLKPEVTAPGGNIWSSVPGNKYEYMSGTSMATPQMAGISAQIHQYVDSDAKFKNLSDTEKTNAVTQLLMSTAQPIADPSVEGSYYSPRKQGAGLANVPAAVKTPVLVSVKKAADASRPKADLGESTDGTWSFTANLTNLSGKAQTYTVSAAALSEQIADGLFQQHSDNWTGKGIDVTFSGGVKNGTITVPANGSASLTVTIAADQKFKDFVAANAPNGTFVDGFLKLTAANTDTAADLSVPFLGFYGDWSQAPVFDGTQGSDNVHIYGSQLSDSNGVPLGVNPLEPDPDGDGVYQPDTSKMVVSNMQYSSSPNQAVPSTGLLRNANELTYEYKNANGKVVKSQTNKWASKSTYSASYNAIFYAEAKSGYVNFDGRDNNGNMLPDGQYTLEQSATTAGPTPTTQRNTTSWTFAYDTTAPKISNAKLNETDEKTYSFDVTDATWLAAIDFHDPTTGGYFYRVNAKDMAEPTVNEDGTRTWHFDVKIADLEAAWKAAAPNEAMPNSMPLIAWDYGTNPSKSVTAVTTPTSATSVKLSSDAVTLTAGQKAELTATIEPANSTDTELEWSSSDSNVVTVDNEGNLAGVANGAATVTVSVKNNPAIKAEAKVTVTDVPAETGVVMSLSEFTVANGDTAEVNAIVSSALKDAKVAWSSSDESIATVTADAKNSTKAVITAGNQTGNATVTATVNGKSATVVVRVRPTDYDQFEIDERTGTLKYYKGNAGYVTVPNNIKVIGESAFQACPMTEVAIPASVERIEKHAFREASNLTTVKFENADRSKLTYVGDQAFYNTLKLDTVNLPDSVTKLGTGVFEQSTIRHARIAGVSEIPDSTFNQDAQLVDVTIADKVTAIGNNAFASASYLSELKLIGREGAANGQTVTGLPSKLRTIGDSAFSGTGFTSIELPKGTTSIGDNAFALVPATTITLNDGLTTVGTSPFQGTSITELVVPNSVRNIGANAFSFMSMLQKITFGPAVPAGSLTAAIISNPSLSQIVVPENAANYKSVGNVLFTKDGTRLTAFPAGLAVDGASYTVPNGVETIEPYAFYHARQLTEVKFPESLRSVGDTAFYEDNLSTLKLPDAIETVGNNAFGNNPLSTVDIGGAITLGDQAFSNNSQLADLDLRSDLNRLATIGKGAFDQVKQLTKLVFPDSLTSVGNMSFANMPELQEVHIGAGMTGSLSMAFTGDPKLSKLTVSEKNPVYSADDNVLYGMVTEEGKDYYNTTMLKGKHLVLSLPNNTFTDYTVQDGTVQIDAQAFRGNTNLKNVTLPESVRIISSGAFNGDSLNRLDLPSNVEIVKDIVASVDTMTYEGTSLRELGSMATHMVIKGGKDLSIADSFLSPTVSTGYFGEGVKGVSFNQGAPETLVLPAGLETFSVSGMALSGDNADASAVNVNKLNIYSANEQVRALATESMRSVLNGMKNATFAWQGQLPKDFDVEGWLSSHILDYTPLSVTLTGENITDKAAGQKVAVQATAAGGVNGSKEVRFLETTANGEVTLLTDWTAADEATGMVSYEWTVPQTPGTLHAEVRDATKLTATGALDMPASPQFDKNLDPTPVQVVTGDKVTLSVKASAGKDAPVHYQWYAESADGTATPIKGADGAEYTVDTTKAGQATYYVVVSVTKNGLTDAVTSAKKSVAVFAKATAPTFVRNLPAALKAHKGDAVTLTIGVQSAEHGTLSYQWYEAPADGSADGNAAKATAIEGATEAQYHPGGAQPPPSTEDAGTRRYFVVVTSTVGVKGNTASAISATTALTVQYSGNGSNGGNGSGDSSNGDNGSSSGTNASVSSDASGKNQHNGDGSGLANSGADIIVFVALAGALTIAAMVMTLGRRSTVKSHKH